ncbi:GSCOCG00000883001-RA-CDS [Cotesia congregata]|nr:GSCOCG00000883001-RA-CDS [Cotesia congregata]
MTIRRLAVLAAIKSNQSNGTTTTILNNDNDQCLLGHNMSANGDVGMFGVDLHNNVFIQGAILMGALMAAVLACYCCLRNSEKTREQERAAYSVAEPDVQSLQVFTTNSYNDREFDEQRYEDWIDRMNEELTSLPACPGTPGPPPPYESLIFNLQNLPSPSQKDGSVIYPSEKEKSDNAKDDKEDDGLPPYDAAIKLAGDGYV